jgi:hypothetical protein
MKITEDNICFSCTLFGSTIKKARHCQRDFVGRGQKSGQKNDIFSRRWEIFSAVERSRKEGITRIAAFDGLLDL